MKLLKTSARFVLASLKGFNVSEYASALRSSAALLDGCFEQLPRTLPLYRNRFESISLDTAAQSL